MDHLNLENYSNLDAWVAALNERIDEVFTERLTLAIDAWCRAFSHVEEDLPNGEDDGQLTGVKVSLASRTSVDPLVCCIAHQAPRARDSHQESSDLP